MPDDKELKDRARVLAPAMAIGKNGITAGAIKQLEVELDHRGLVKVKLLRGYLDQEHDRKIAAQELATLARARLVQLVGNVVVLYRPIKDAPAPLRPAAPRRSVHGSQAPRPVRIRKRNMDRRKY